jgi:hypothetical protein
VEDATEIAQTATDSVTTAAENLAETVEDAVTDATDSLSGASDESPAGDDTPAADQAGDSPSDGLAGDDHVEADDTTSPDDTPDSVSTDGDETVTLMPEDAERPIEDATVIEPAADPEPSPAPAPPAPAPERRGGFVPLLLGGVIAAGIGYGATYMGWLPTAGDDDGGAIATALEQQSSALAALQAQVTELANAAPATPEPAQVDLSPVLDEIAALTARVDSTAGTITALAERVSVIEDRPIFSGDIDADAAAAVEAAQELEAELTAQREAAAARAAELQAEVEAAAQAAEQAAAEAAEAIAAAEAEAAAAAVRAQTEAALVTLRAALETGEPYDTALATIAETAEIPEGLSANADAGVPTLEALQAAYPPLARAALPVALQETAGDGMGDRLGAFVMGQIGGRAVEPREGDDPDAVLSRVEAAVRSGDLPAALSEIAALPQGARDVLAPWVADVEARAAAVEGLAALTETVSGNGN